MEEKKNKKGRYILIIIIVLLLGSSIFIYCYQTNKYQKKIKFLQDSISKSTSIVENCQLSSVNQEKIDLTPIYLAEQYAKLYITQTMEKIREEVKTSEVLELEEYVIHNIKIEYSTEDKMVYQVTYDLKPKVSNNIIKERLNCSVDNNWLVGCNKILTVEKKDNSYEITNTETELALQNVESYNWRK